MIVSTTCQTGLSSGGGIVCPGTGQFQALARSAEPAVELAHNPETPDRRVNEVGGSHTVSNIPESFILIGIITAIPVAGVIAALIAARLPSNRADS
ncbi:MAG: hypothetical protein ACE5FP_04495 [Gemmatimonadota bacterium]